MVAAGLVNERYRLDTLVARGGMGEIWQAYDLVLRRTVAVKVLTATTGATTERERFVREARSAAQLSHPNVVAVYDFGEWNDRPYLVMELLAGETLSGLLAARGPLPIEQVTDLGAQICAALQAAHAAGVVHRDIKPSNLILTPDGVLKVVDFGIAGVVDDASTRLTQAGTIVGTAAYLAPERVNGSVADAASDIYALGCVLYELLCGSPPFTGGMATTVYAHLHQPPEPPALRRQGVPADLDGLLLSMLAKDPQQRPTAAAARAALRDPATQVIPAPPPGSPPTAAHAMPPPEPPQDAEADHEHPRRAGTPWLIGGAVVLVVLAAVGLLLWSIGDDPPPEAGQRPAPTETTQASPSATPTPTPTPTPTVTPARQRPPFATRAWFVAFDRQLDRRAPGEDIDAEVHKKLDELVDKALEAYAENRPQRARQHAWEMVKKVREASKEGKVFNSFGLLQDLLDRMDQAGNRDGDGNDKGDGNGDGDGDGDGEDGDDEDGGKKGRGG